MSFVPVGAVLFRSLFAASSMLCDEAMVSVTVALTLARLPPLAVTLYAPVTPETAVTDVTVAVVPLTAKSAASTFETASLNVTRQVRLSALVGELVGFCRAIEATVGTLFTAVPSSSVAVTVSTVLITTS